MFLTARISDIVFYIIYNGLQTVCGYLILSDVWSIVYCVG